MVWGFGHRRRRDQARQRWSAASKERGRPAAELRPGEELERHGGRSWTWALAGPVKVHPSLTEEDEEETLLI